MKLRLFRRASSGVARVAAVVAKFLWVEIELRDLLLFGGILALAHGAGMVYMPAFWIVLGLGLSLVGYFGLFQDWLKVKVLTSRKRDDAA